MIVGDDGVGHISTGELLVGLTWTGNLALAGVQFNSSLGSWVQVTGGYDFHANSTFSGSGDAQYRWCDVFGFPPFSKPTGCTNYAPIHLISVSLAPRVTSVVAPTEPNLPILVTFDQQVKGLTTSNVRLTRIDFTAFGVQVVPLAVNISCRSVFLPGSASNCSEFADAVYLTPTEPLQENGFYNVRVNHDGQVGIVAVGTGNLPLVAYESSFTGAFVQPDGNAPVASPVASPAANGAGWNTGDVTVAWNWSDGSGSGIDPAACTTSSTSSGTGNAVTVSATCKDLEGNTGSASYVVKVDTLAPVSSPSASPAANSFGWNNSDVTVAWNWSDGSDRGSTPRTARRRPRPRARAPR